MNFTQLPDFYREVTAGGGLRAHLTSAKRWGDTPTLTAFCCARTGVRGMSAGGDSHFTLLLAYGNRVHAGKWLQEGESPTVRVTQSGRAS